MHANHGVKVLHQQQEDMGNKRLMATKHTSQWWSNSHSTKEGTIG